MISVVEQKSSNIEIYNLNSMDLSEAYSIDFICFRGNLVFVVLR
jgi:hypothetical protein